MRTQLTCLVVSVGFALVAMPADSQTVFKYDPGLGTLPEAQGYRFDNFAPSAPLPSVAGGVLKFGPTSDSDAPPM